MKPILYLVICLTCLVPSVAKAISPEGTVQAAINKIKSRGELSALVEQVDWERNFSELPPEGREALGFHDAQAMKHHYENKMKAQGQDVVDKVQKDVRQAKGDYVYQARANAKSVQAAQARQSVEMRNRIKNTSYSIGSVKRQENVAIVTVFKTFNGATKEVQVTLRDKGGVWLLETAAPLNPYSSPISGASPVGMLPQPTDVLIQR